MLPASSYTFALYLNQYGTTQRTREETIGVMEENE